MLARQLMNTSEIKSRSAFSVKEIAESLGVSVRTIWKLVKSGELSSFRVKTRVLISKSALEQFIVQKTRASNMSSPALD